MYNVCLREGKQLGWSCKNGRDVEFYDVKGKFLHKVCSVCVCVCVCVFPFVILSNPSFQVAQRDCPKLAIGKREV
jgi:hypothetical protein